MSLVLLIFSQLFIIIIVSVLDVGILVEVEGVVVIIDLADDSEVMVAVEVIGGDSIDLDVEDYTI